MDESNLFTSTKANQEKSSILKTVTSLSVLCMKRWNQFQVTVCRIRGEVCHLRGQVANLKQIQHLLERIYLNSFISIVNLKGFFTANLHSILNPMLRHYIALL
jgi:hypothetical protein